MAVREVVRYPDTRLKQVCAPVDLTGPASDDIERIAHDLLETMESFPGCVGIAAPQIGEIIQLCAIDVTGHKRAKSCHGRQLLFNPVVIARRGLVKMREGCLSIPDFTGNVTRAEEITVRAQNLSGEFFEMECDAYEARVILHELDHLDGLLFLDRVQHARDVFPRKRYQ